MRYKADFSFSPINHHCSATPVTATGIAPHRREYPSQSRHDGQQYNTHMRVHHPYGNMPSFSQFGDLVRHSFIIPESPPGPTNVEVGQASTQTSLSSSPRKPGRWQEFIFTLICQTISCLQMQLPSAYFLRVAEVIRESGISMVDFASIQRPGPQQAFMRMILIAGTPGMPNISKIHTQRFKKKWRAFIMRCMEEWRNLNVISALLLR